MISNVAKSIPGVESVEGWLTIEGKLKKADQDKEDTIAFVAPPSNSTLIKPLMVSGRWLKPGDRNVIVIGNHLQKIRPALQINDWVEIKVNGKKTRWQIIGFYRMPGNVDPPLLYTNYEYLSHLVGMTNKVQDLRAITYDHDSLSQSTISEEMQNVFKKRKISVSYVQTAAEWLQQQKSQTDVLAYCMLIMAGLIATVGGLGLSNTMNLNVMERTREIGVMRALGATNRRLMTIILSEGLAIGALGWLAGSLLAYPLSKWLTQAVGLAVVQNPFTHTYSVWGAALWLVLELALSALACALPARRACQITIREAIVYE